MGFRIIGLWVTVALLVAGCPSSKKKSGVREACAKISNTIVVGDECQCRSGYAKIAQIGDQFQCNLLSTTSCRSPAYFDSASNMCTCSNNSIYNPHSQNPCGSSFGNSLGVPTTELQRVCTGAGGQWRNNGFCACSGQKQQFNYFSRMCEPVSYHHTQEMCGNGATFYGASGRGVCVCQNSQALFHPSFGGCTNIGTEIISTMCDNIYGTSVQRGGCGCPQGGVWFRGSCLNLGNDFISSLPSHPPITPDLRCELQGKNWNGTQCEDVVWGGGGYYGEGPTQPITCERRSLINGSRECVVIHGNMVQVTESSRWGSTPIRHNYTTENYFRYRCEGVSLDRGRWVPGVGKYHEGIGDPFYGMCACTSPHNVRYSAYRDRKLGYQYCVSVGTDPSLYTACEGFSLRNVLDNLSVAVKFGSDGRTDLGASYEGCAASFNVTTSMHR